MNSTGAPSSCFRRRLRPPLALAPLACAPGRGLLPGRGDLLPLDAASASDAGDDGVGSFDALWLLWSSTGDGDVVVTEEARRPRLFFCPGRHSSIGADKVGRRGFDPGADKENERCSEDDIT